LAALTIDHQPGSGEHEATGVGVQIALLTGGECGGVGGKNLRMSRVVGCQSVSGGLGEGPGGQTGVDASSVASGASRCHHPLALYTLTQSVMLSA
jgi:hypothetical protein